MSQERPECKGERVFYGITLSYCAAHDHLIVMFSGPVPNAIPAKCLEAAKDVSDTVRGVLEESQLLTSRSARDV